MAVQGTKFDDLTVEQFRAVSDAVKMIEHEGKWKEKLFNQEIKLTVTQAAEGIASSAYENVGINYSSKNYKPLPQKLKKAADKFNSWVIGTENIIWEVDGRKFDGIFRQVIWEPLVGSAFTKNSDLTYEAQGKISQIWSEYSEADLWNMREKSIYVSELDDSFTKMEMIVIALNCGTEDNYRKLKEGRNWTDDNVNTILNNYLDEKDWQAINGIWDLLDSYYSLPNELEKKTKGIALKKVPGRIVETRYGNMEGKYYPLKSDRENINTPSRQVGERQSNRAKTQQGHTKSRTNATYAVFLDEEWLYQHLERVIYDLAYPEVGIDASRILYHKTTESALKQTIGSDKYEEVTRAISKTIRNTSEPMIAGEEMVRWIRTRTVSSLMSGKNSVMFQQISGIFSAAGMIGVGPILNGIMAVAFNKENINFIKKESAFMKERPKTRNRDIKDSYRRITGELGGSPKWIGRTPKKALDTISELGFKGISIMDMIVAMPTWYGAYLDGLRQFEGNEKRAKIYADTAVRESQGAGHAIDQAAFQREGNEYIKILSAFATPGIALYRLIWRNIQQVKNNDLSYLRADFNIVLAATAQGAFAEVLAGRGPEEDEDYLKWAVKESLNFMASSIPIFRDVVSFTLGESREVVSSPISAPLQSAARLVQAGFKVMNGQNVNTDAVFKESVKLAGFGFAFPQQLGIYGYKLVDWVFYSDELTPADIMRFRRTRN